MPVRNEGRITRGQLAFRQLHRKTLKTSSASSKLGLFMGQDTFGRGWSFWGEVVLLARSTGYCGSRPRGPGGWVEDLHCHDNSLG